MDYAAARVLAGLWKNSRSGIEDAVTRISGQGIVAYRSKYLGDTDGPGGVTACYELSLDARQTEELCIYLGGAPGQPPETYNRQITAIMSESFRRFQSRSNMLTAGICLGFIALLVAIAMLNLHQNGWAYLFGIAWMALMVILPCAERWMISRILSRAPLGKAMEEVKKARSPFSGDKRVITALIVCLVVMAASVLGIVTDAQWWEDTQWLYQKQEYIRQIPEILEEEQSKDSADDLLPPGTSTMKGDELPESVKKYLEGEGISISDDEQYRITWVP